MSDRAALITALILDRPLCLPCIADKSLVTPERAREAIAIIGGALVVSTQTDRCTVCGTTTTVYSVGRPRLA